METAHLLWNLFFSSTTCPDVSVAYQASYSLGTWVSVPRGKVAELWS